ncbi:extensin-like [Salvelinus namaycush]|uniref:Extensin-like n=1 Tax=Salvelinus namaycush TaxID=8040 RepID=A0A8U0P273_SALNM|nr:extensin-like [Salvelinus namaycush]
MTGQNSGACDKLTLCRPDVPQNPSAQPAVLPTVHATDHNPVTHRATAMVTPPPPPPTSPTTRYTQSHCCGHPSASSTHIPNHPLHTEPLLWSPLRLLLPHPQPPVTHRATAMVTPPPPPPTSPTTRYTQSHCCGHPSASSTHIPNHPLHTEPLLWSPLRLLLPHPQPPVTHRATAMVTPPPPPPTSPTTRYTQSHCYGHPSASSTHIPNHPLHTEPLLWSPLRLLLPHPQPPVTHRATAMVTPPPPPPTSPTTRYTQSHCYGHPSASSSHIPNHPLHTEPLLWSPLRLLLPHPQPPVTHRATAMVTTPPPPPTSPTTRYTQSHCYGQPSASSTHIPNHPLHTEPLLWSPLRLLHPHPQPPVTHRATAMVTPPPPPPTSPTTRYTQSHCYGHPSASSSHIPNHPLHTEPLLWSPLRLLHPHPQPPVTHRATAMVTPPPPPPTSPTTRYTQSHCYGHPSASSTHIPNHPLHTEPLLWSPLRLLLPHPQPPITHRATAMVTPPPPPPTSPTTRYTQSHCYGHPSASSTHIPNHPLHTEPLLWSPLRLLHPHPQPPVTHRATAMVSPPPPPPTSPTTRYTQSHCYGHPSASSSHIPNHPLHTEPLLWSPLRLLHPHPQPPVTHRATAMVSPPPPPPTSPTTRYTQSHCYGHPSASSTHIPNHPLHTEPLLWSPLRLLLPHPQPPVTHRATAMVTPPPPPPTSPTTRYTQSHCYGHPSASSSHIPNHPLHTEPLLWSPLRLLHPHPQPPVTHRATAMVTPPPPPPTSPTTRYTQSHCYGQPSTSSTHIPNHPLHTEPLLCGSSHGQTCIIRKAYDEDYYTHMMEECYQLWSQLEKEANVKLYR